MDAFRNMHVFVEVASTGGFRAAAERLGMPNSTISRRVSELERDIGLRLFNRTTRRVELTEAGRIYYERCRHIIDEAQRAQEELSGMVTRPTGLIRASVPVDFTQIYLSQVLADFLRLYPGISLDLDVTPRQSNLVSEPVDLTIRIGEPREQNLIIRKLVTTDAALYASPDYLAVHGRPETPQDLIDHNCMRTVDRSWNLVERSSGKVETIPVSGTLIANNIGLMRTLAVQGMGIVVLTRPLITTELTEGKLVQVLPDWQPKAISVYAVTETRLVPAKVRVFIDFLSQRLKAIDESLQRFEETSPDRVQEKEHSAFSVSK